MQENEDGNLASKLIKVIFPFSGVEKLCTPSWCQTPGSDSKQDKVFDR